MDTVIEDSPFRYPLNSIWDLSVMTPKPMWLVHMAFLGLAWCAIGRLAARAVVWLGERVAGRSALSEGGVFSPGVDSTNVAEHLSGRRNWMAQLSNVLMFQAWLEQQ